jgi:GTPase
MARSSPDVGAALDAARSGDRGALARLLSQVERGGEAAREIGRAVGGAASPSADVSAGYTIGMTGAPGAGKSTLTNTLVGLLRERDERVAVLAVDPSSPFSGGAILGDRVRMGDHALDPGVFIRSMATRGHLGGLAVAAPEAVRLLAAAGFDRVILETVGVGQVEVEVAGQADTTVVVVNPGWGDAVQAAKAGLTEIADVFVVNKADRPGAAAAARDLERMLDMTGVAAGSGATAEPDDDPGLWRPPVLLATATSGDRVAEVLAEIDRHRDHQERTGGLAERRRARAADEITRLVGVRLMEQARALTSGTAAADLADEVASGTLDPWTAADRLLADPGSAAATLET